MILDLIHIKPPLTGEAIALSLKETFKEWDIEDKIFGITSDSGGNCFLASKLLRLYP